MTRACPAPSPIAALARACDASLHNALWSLHDALWRRTRARRAVQAVRVARTLRPSARFVLDVMRDSTPRRYVSKQSGLVIYLRPRLDLQVAREVLGQNVYELPVEVRAVLDRCGSPLTVLDLGANIGLFALSSIHLLGDGTRVVAVEADPGSAELLRLNLWVNDRDDQVSVHAVAAGHQAGRARFAAGRGDVSRVVAQDDPGGSIEVPVVDAFELANGCDLIKMDIEGSEWDLLRDPRMGKLDAKALVVEWHASRFGTHDPASEAVRLLHGAGFCTRELASRATTGIVWGWRAPDHR